MGARDRVALGQVTRAASKQSRPPKSLAGFPRTTLRRGQRIFRAARRAPGFFCSCGNCRFDLAEPNGTLYVGTDALVGLLETIGPHLAGGVVSRQFLEERRIFSRRLSADLPVANLASRRAAGFGVTNELATMTPYDVPRAWAAALYAAGYAGIRYRTRFDVGAGARGLALFGDEGERGWRAQDDGPADTPAMVRRLQGECNITVADRPRLDQLEVQ
jgi:hypothetical protein